MKNKSFGERSPNFTKGTIGCYIITEYCAILLYFFASAEGAILVSFLLIFFSFVKLLSFKFWCGVAGVIFRCCTGYPMGIKANQEKTQKVCVV